MVSSNCWKASFSELNPRSALEGAGTLFDCGWTLREAAESSRCSSGYTAISMHPSWTSISCTQSICRTCHATLHSVNTITIASTVFDNDIFIHFLGISMIDELSLFPNWSHAKLTFIVHVQLHVQHMHSMYTCMYNTCMPCTSACTAHTIHVHVYVQYMVDSCTSACITHRSHVHMYVQDMESACTSACTTHTIHRVHLPCSSCSLPPPFRWSSTPLVGAFGVLLINPQAWQPGVLPLCTLRASPEAHSLLQPKQTQKVPSSMAGLCVLTTSHLSEHKWPMVIFFFVPTRYRQVWTLHVLVCVMTHTMSYQDLARACAVATSLVQEAPDAVWTLHVLVVWTLHVLVCVMTHTSFCDIPQNMCSIPAWYKKHQIRIFDYQIGIEGYWWSFNSANAYTRAITSFCVFPQNLCRTCART